MTFKLEIELGSDGMLSLMDVEAAIKASFGKFGSAGYGTSAELKLSETCTIREENSGNLVGKWSVEK